MPDAAGTQCTPFCPAQDAEVRRDVEGAVDVVESDVGQRQVAERAVEARPRRGPVPRVVGHREDVTRCRRGRGVEAAVRDPDVVRIVRVDRQPGREAIRVGGRQLVEPQEGDCACRVRISVLADEDAAVRGRRPQRRRAPAPGRSTIETIPPVRSPQPAAVNAVVPSGAQSPQGSVKRPGELVAVRAELRERHRAHAVRLRADDRVRGGRVPLPRRTSSGARPGR